MKNSIQKRGYLKSGEEIFQRVTFANYRPHDKQQCENEH
jgi:hypothetical protein